MAYANTPGDHSIENLFIVDNEVVEEAETVKSKVVECEQIFYQFILAAANMQVEGIMEGQTAQHFTDFIHAVASGLGNSFSGIASVYKTNAGNYLNNIDEADQMLFGGE